MEVHGVVAREEVEMWNISAVLEKLAQLIDVGLRGKRWLLHNHKDRERFRYTQREEGGREIKEYLSDVGFCLMLYY